MSSFKKFLRENQELVIPGVGTLTREQLPESIQRRMEDVVERLSKGQFASVYSILYEAGVIKAMLKVMADVEKAERESPEEEDEI